MLIRDTSGDMATSNSWQSKGATLKIKLRYITATRYLIKIKAKKIDKWIPREFSDVQKLRQMEIARYLKEINTICFEKALSVVTKSGSYMIIENVQNNNLIDTNVQNAR